MDLHAPVLGGAKHHADAALSGQQVEDGTQDRNSEMMIESESESPH